MISSRWIVAPLTALVVALAVACGGGSDDGNGDANGDANGNGSSSSPAQQTGAQNGSSTTPDGTLDVASLASTLEQIDSFRFNMSMRMNVGDAGSGDDAAMAAAFMALLGNIEAEGAYVSPDRYHMTTSVFGMKFETIQIGAESWINEGSGWALDSAGGSFSMLPFEMDSPAGLPFEFLPETELAGATTTREKVNGFDTTRYSFDRDALESLADVAGDAGGLDDLGEIDSMTLDVWITDEGVPVKMRVAVEAETDGVEFSMEIDFTLSDFNDPSISIERPL